MQEHRPRCQSSVHASIWPRLLLYQEERGSLIQSKPPITFNQSNEFHLLLWLCDTMGVSFTSNQATTPLYISQNELCVITSPWLIFSLVLDPFGYISLVRLLDSRVTFQRKITANLVRVFNLTKLSSHWNKRASSVLKSGESSIRS